MFTCGMIPSPPDERDYPLAKAVAYAASPPQNIRVSHIPESFDQGSIGCCVAASGAKLLSAIEHKQRGIWKKISVAFIYGNRKPTDLQGEGMIPREAGMQLTRFGSPDWDKLPGIYDFPTSQRMITPAIDGDGVPNRPLALVRLSTVQDIYDYMRIFDLPVWFGFNVYENIGRDGNIPAPAGQFLGGHMVIGVELKLPRLVIQNTWKDWGTNWEGSINLDEHRGWEAWGLIPEDSNSLIQRKHEILLTIGSSTVWADDQRLTTDVAPFIKDGRTFVPLRLIAELFGGKVTFTSVPGGGMILIQTGGEFNLKDYTQ